MPGLESASAIIPTVVALPKSYRSPGRTRRSGARPYRERIVPHWLVEVPSDHGDDDRRDVKNPPDDGNAEINVSFNGGAIIPHVSVLLLFWGNQWTQQNVSPSISSVISAIQKILAGPYMSALGQYGIGPGTLSGATIITWPGPPNPFFADDWHTLIWDLIDNGTFPKPDSPGARNFYCFVLPPGVNFNDPNAVGASWFLGIACRLPPTEVIKHFEKGFGDVLSFVGIVIGLGAMLGGILISSGGADVLANDLIALGGKKWIPWTMFLASLLIGLPLFFEVGFVLLVPLAFVISKRMDTPILRVGLPMLAGLSIAHALIPPHPAPTLAVATFHADAGKTILYAILVGIPTGILAGPVFANFAAGWVHSGSTSGVLFGTGPGLCPLSFC